MEAAKTLTCSSSYKFVSFLTFLLFISSMHTTLASTTTTYTTYLKTACNSTTYPQLCYRSLYSYASKIKTNPLKLCNTALSITLKSAKNASSNISMLLKQKGLKSNEIAIIKDCIENIKDSISELRDSLKALGQLGAASNVEFQMANIKTWVSAALTDEDTCMDGFDGQKVSAWVKMTIRRSILNVARLTSNALSLINSLTY